MGEDEMTSLEYLQSIYRDPLQMDGVRMKAAVAALPFEHPKLSVNANVTSFASVMEAYGRQTGRSNVIDAKSRYDVSAPLKIEPPPKPSTIQTDVAAVDGFKRRL